jgi:hypothetical protein
MQYNIISLGSCCSPAGALRTLQLRNFALPFDWIVSQIDMLDKCFEQKFENFHKDLHFSTNKRRLIDYYGFEFPHDYPHYNMDIDEFQQTKLINEDQDTTITENWQQYYNTVIEKYQRRIQRFLDIMKDTKPMIVFCRYKTVDVLRLQQVVKKHFNVHIFIVNSSHESYENDTIINVNTEKHNIWNDSTVWKKGLDDIIKKIEMERNIPNKLNKT